MLLALSCFSQSKSDTNKIRVYEVQDTFIVKFKRFKTLDIGISVEGNMLGLNSFYLVGTKDFLGFGFGLTIYSSDKEKTYYTYDWYGPVNQTITNRNYSIIGFFDLRFLYEHIIFDIYLPRPVIGVGIGGHAAWLYPYGGRVKNGELSYGPLASLYAAAYLGEMGKISAGAEYLFFDKEREIVIGYKQKKVGGFFIKFSVVF